MFIDPAKAQEFLATMPLNRRARSARVEHLARMIQEDKFRVTHQGIAFNCDGSLKDGQHRLLAVIRSGKGIWLWVYYGLANDAMRVIDTHASRSDADGLTLSGVEATKDTVAVAKRMQAGITTGDNQRPVDRDELANFITFHREALTFAIHSMGAKSKGITHACVIGTIARAYYTADRERLLEFIEVLKTGISSNAATDTPAIKFRDFLLTSPLIGGGSMARASVSKRAERVLSAFLKREPLGRVTEAAEELFEIPDYRKAKDA
jgi:hypothetical protein